MVQYGIQTPTSKTILMLTEDRDEAERMLDMVGEGTIIKRTVVFGPWRVDADLAAADLSAAG